MKAPKIYIVCSPCDGYGHGSQNVCWYFDESEAYVFARTQGEYYSVEELEAGDPMNEGTRWR